MGLRMRVFLCVTISLLLFTCTISTLEIAREKYTEESISEIDVKITSYTPHDPISIYGNSEFEALDSAEDLPGDGTPGNPFILEGYSITNEDRCIEIYTVSHSFIIRNCLLVATGADLGNGAIAVVGVLDCTIFNNTCVSYGAYGIAVNYCSGTVIANNTILDSKIGLFLITADNCVVANNTLDNCGLSITGSDSQDWHHQMENNTVNGKPLGYFWNQGGTVDASNLGQVVVASCDGLVIENGNFENNTNGIIMAYSSNCNITDTFIRYNSEYGLYMWYSEDCSLIRNTIEDCIKHGALVHYSHNSTFEENTISRNNHGVSSISSENCTFNENTVSDNLRGVYLQSAPKWNFSLNTFSNNGVFIYGNEAAWNHSFLDDTVNGKPIGYFYNEFDLNLDGTPFGQLLIGNCTRVSFEGGIFTHIDFGVVIAHCVNSSFEDMTLQNNRWGLHAQQSEHVRVANVTVTENSAYGMDIYDCENLTIVNCQISLNQVGVYLDQSRNCTLRSNNCTDNMEIGLHVYISRHSIIEDSNISNNQDFGVRIYQGTNNTVKNCVVTNNTDYGVYLYFTNNCTVSKCNMTDGLAGGLVALHVDNCSFFENRIWNNEAWGIQLDGSTCTIRNNILTNNTSGGVFISGSQGTDVIENDIQDNRRSGVFIGGHSTNTLVERNNISNNFHSGVGLSTSNSTTIIWNYIENNHLGVQIDSACWFNIIYGNTIGWPPHYIAHDAGTGNTWDDGISLGNFWGDYDFSGPYIVPGPTGSIDRYPQRADTVIPVFNPISDIQYESGTIGHWINWTVGEDHLSSFSVLRNGSEVELVELTDDLISVNVDNLELGKHNYTIIVVDTCGNYASDMVWVTVNDSIIPVIDHPSDLQYEEGQVGFSISWSPSDVNPATYEVFRDDQLIKYGLWNSSDDVITIDVDGLTHGSYIYHIVVSDAAGNIVEDYVVLTVTEATITTTTTTTTTTDTTSTTDTTTTTTTQGSDPVVMLVILTTVGSVVVVLIIIFIRKRSES